eukprot:TRINITY_DN13588_c0_g1_i2.p1 TRINITY_DN13588_c0_g1~~TRINITY_DN13588_c0_g1_i2.p1  ORF type:complete len:174 (+),score=24.27 TRINITY_DN13588_c0_g1_i2:30-524(+)
MAAAKQLLHSSRAALHVPFSSSSSPPLNFNSQVFWTQRCVHCTKLSTTSTGRILSIAPNWASSQSDGVIEADIDGGGVPLGTMKLPLDINVDRFETLLFQWANSLCQGANLPLPVPLKTCSATTLQDQSSIPCLLPKKEAGPKIHPRVTLPPLTEDGYLQPEPK